MTRISSEVEAASRSIDRQMEKVESSAFVWAALGSVAISATLRAFGRKDASQFVGQWAPTLMTLAVYDRLVRHTAEERG